MQESLTGGRDTYWRRINEITPGERQTDENSELRVSWICFGGHLDSFRDWRSGAELEMKTKMTTAGADNHWLDRCVRVVSIVRVLTFIAGVDGVSNRLMSYCSARYNRVECFWFNRTMAVSDSWNIGCLLSWMCRRSGASQYGVRSMRDMKKQFRLQCKRRWSYAANDHDRVRTLTRPRLDTPTLHYHHQRGGSTFNVQPRPISCSLSSFFPSLSVGKPPCLSGGIFTTNASR